jgi:hypothetical protein
VIGMSRFPVFEDRESLPYINAVCSEVLRWHPVVPLGVAHRLMQDDVYGDYFIPGGSVVVGNSWFVVFMWREKILTRGVFLGQFCMTRNYMARILINFNPSVSSGLASRRPPPNLDSDEGSV